MVMVTWTLALNQILETILMCMCECMCVRTFFVYRSSRSISGAIHNNVPQMVCISFAVVFFDISKSQIFTSKFLNKTLKKGSYLHDRDIVFPPTR